MSLFLSQMKHELSTGGDNKYFFLICAIFEMPDKSSKSKHLKGQMKL